MIGGCSEKSSVISAICLIKTPPRGYWCKVGYDFCFIHNSRWCPTNRDFELITIELDCDFTTLSENQVIYHRGAQSFETVFNPLCGSYTTPRYMRSYKDCMCLAEAKNHEISRDYTRLTQKSCENLCNLVVLYAGIYTILSKYYQSYLMALHIHDIREIRSNVSLVISLSILSRIP